MVASNIKQKYLERLDQLIQKGQFVPVRSKTTSHTSYINRSLIYNQVYKVDWPSFIEWRTNCISILDQVIPRACAHRDTFEALKKLRNSKDELEYLISFLKSIQDDFENGFLDNLAIEIEAEVSADYMSQAELLLGEGRAGNFDHIPAAVLAGAVLEKSLRTLCAKLVPPEPTVNDIGKCLQLNALTDALKKRKVFNELVAKELRSWADIRNHAAHGQFDQFDKQQVGRMISGIKTFLAQHLS